MGPNASPAERYTGWPILLTSSMQLTLSRQTIEEITETTVAQIYKRSGRDLSECIGRMKEEIVTLLPEVTCEFGSPLVIY